MRSSRLIRIAIAAAGCAGLSLSACGGDEPDRRRAGDTTCDGKIGGTTYVTAWFHVSDVADAERATLREQVKVFNASQRQVRVKLVTLPIGEYDDQVRSAAATGNLPDILDFDGPNLYNYAWSGKLKPIDSCLSKGLRADLLPSLRQQGTYAGRLWGMGTFDSGLGLYVRRSILEKADIRIPRGPDDAWTADEFTDILRRLPAGGIPATARPPVVQSLRRVEDVRICACRVVGRRRPDRPPRLPQGRWDPQRAGGGQGPDDRAGMVAGPATRSRR